MPTSEDHKGINHQANPFCLCYNFNTCIYAGEPTTEEKAKIIVEELGLVKQSSLEQSSFRILNTGGRVASPKPCPAELLSCNSSKQLHISS